MSDAQLKIVSQYCSPHKNIFLLIIICPIKDGFFNTVLPTRGYYPRLSSVPGLQIHGKTREKKALWRPRRETNSVHTLHSGNQKKALSLRSHEIAQFENLKITKWMTTLSRNSKNKLHCSLTCKQSLTQTFGAALSWWNVAKVLRTGENGTDFSHALCPASLKKREREKSTFTKVLAYIYCLTKISGTNLGLSWCWVTGVTAQICAIVPRHPLIFPVSPMNDTREETDHP